MKSKITAIFSLFLMGCSSVSVKEASEDFDATNAEKAYMDCFVLYSDLLDLAKAEDPSAKIVGEYEINVGSLGTASHYALTENGRTRDQMNDFLRARAEYVHSVKQSKSSFLKLYNDCDTQILPSAKRIEEIISKSKK